MKRERILIYNNYNLWINDEHKLKDINFEVYKDESIVIYGQRGAGKTLLLRSAVRLNEEVYKKIKKTGEIVFSKTNIESIPVSALRESIFYIDSRYLENISYLTLTEIFLLTLGIKPFEVNRNHLYMLEKVGLLNKFIDKKSIKLFENLKDWHMRDKMALLIFLVLAKSPQVVIFDAILDHVDDFMLYDIKELILQSAKEGRVFIFSTRNISRLLDIADRVIYLKEGKIEKDLSKKSFVMTFEL